MPDANADQLSLAIDAGGSTTTLPRLRPMLPINGERPFDDPAWFFEPWWPGTPALLYLEAGSVTLSAGHLADPGAAFPELAGIGAQFAADRLIVEGSLLVLDADGRPDAELLRRRLAEPSTRAGTPAFVCSDLLQRDDRALVTLPFEVRRAQLAGLIEDGDACVISRGLVGEGVTLAAAVASMGLAEISARLLAGRYRPGQQDDAWLRLPVIEAPAPQTRPLLTLLQRLPL